MRLLSVTPFLLVVTGCEGGFARHAALSLSEELTGVTEPVEVWAHVKTVGPEGAITEQTRMNKDAALVARLPEITSPDFVDPSVDVQIQDVGRGDREGGEATYETRVVLVPRLPADEAHEDAVFRELAGMSYEQWRSSRRARHPEPDPTDEDRLPTDVADARRLGEGEIRLMVHLKGASATSILPRPSSPVPMSALDALAWRVRRNESIVTRGDEVVELQRPFVDWFEGVGGTVGL